MHKLYFGEPLQTKWSVNHNAGWVPSWFYYAPLIHGGEKQNLHLIWKSEIIWKLMTGGIILDTWVETLHLPPQISEVRLNEWE